MNVPLLIAKRYLFARKTHRAIGIISAVSAAGIAIGTAVLVVILSVFNGFDGLIRSSIASLDPDLKVSPATGKIIDPEEATYAAAADWLSAQAGISATEVLEEQVFLLTDGHQSLVSARGVEDDVLQTAGKPNAGTLELYYPSRKKPVSLQNPAASLQTITLRPGEARIAGADQDRTILFVPRHLMRELLEYETECSAMHVRFGDGLSAGEQKRIEEGLRERLGSHYLVRDRVAQNSSLFKMLNYEKGAIFLILLFVVVIVAFNIFGSLSMLILEKQPDIATLGSLGADRSLVRRIFFTEGALVSGIGLVIGLAVGIGITILQQQVGLVHMPGNFAIEYYPVVLRWEDLALVTGGVAAIGLLIAFLSSRTIHPLTR